ncbi:hypothetical protein TNCV_812621 [Trichonephila clavipes]|nr:hypothetical protein TNCV_812621 [Trichonephila clavipes]
MITCFVEENHYNWDRFLHEFSFALLTVVNETTGKTPAELILGCKNITPSHKLVRVTEGAKYVGGNIEKSFDETFKGSSNQRQMRRFSPPKEESRLGARVQFGRAQETRTTGSKGQGAAEGRPVRSRKTTAV